MYSVLFIFIGILIEKLVSHIFFKRKYSGSLSISEDMEKFVLHLTDIPKEDYIVLKVDKTLRE